MANIVVISGPSGAGKGTVIQKVLDAMPRLKLPVSATTREQRPGEMHGRDYYFVTVAEFEKCIARGELIEWAEVHDNYYGTFKSEVEYRLRLGGAVLVEIDVQGGIQLKAAYPESKLIFIDAPSQEVLEQRLRSRGTDDDGIIAVRLANAEMERQLSEQYDHRVINLDLDLAVKEVVTLIRET